MKRFLILSATLVVIAGAAAVVAPEFVDWNAYRGVIAEQVELQTGRKVAFAGDIGISLLPKPALVAGEVRISNIDGAATPDMVRLKSLQLSIALAPLLTGRLHFESARLVEPELDLEILADGRPNWRFDPPARATDAAPAADGHPAAPAAGDHGPAVRFDNLVIERGRILFRDARDGREERIDGINATIAAASLRGPLDGDGAFAWRGVPMRFEVAVGEAIQDRTIPVTVVLNLPAGDSRVQLAGALLGLGEKPRFKGALKAEGRSLGGVLGATAGLGAAPAALNQDYALEADVLITAAAAESEQIRLRLGETRATARASATFADDVEFRAELDIPRLDIDRLAALPAAAAPAPAATAGPAPRADSPPQPKAAADAPVSLSLPRGVHGLLDARVEAITWRDGVIGQVRMNGELAGGELLVSQLSAQFPGGSDAALFGIVSTPDGRPHFDGEVEAKAGDMRRVLRWLGLPMPDVPGDRLRALSLRVGRLTAGPEQVSLAGIEARMDGSRLTGGVTLALRERPAFGAAIEIDRLNLDGYRTRPPAAGAGATPAPATAPAASSAGAPDAAPPNAFEDLFAALDGFDCNLRLEARQLTFNATPVQALKLDATLVQGALTVRDLSAADFAGAAISLRGGLETGAGSPALRGVEGSLQAREPERLFRALGVGSPVVARDLGPVTFNIALDGGLAAPALKARLRFRDGEAEAEGTLGAVASLRGADLRLKVRHEDMARLTRLFGADYRPAGALGPVDASGRLRGTAAGFDVEGLSGRFGPVQAQGAVEIATGGRRPRVVARLQADTIDVDRFLPAARTALDGTAPAPRVIPAAWAPRPPAVPSAITLVARAAPRASDRWSRKAVDLDVLDAIDGELALTARTLAHGPYRLDGAEAAVVLANGTLRVNRLTGTLFGGAFQGQASVESLPAPRIGLSATLKDARLADALKALAGTGAASGLANLDLTLAGAGASEAELVASLDGEGSIALSGVDAGPASAGGALAPALGLLRGLGGVAAALGGGTPAALADLAATFRVADGIARSEDVRLTSPLYTGSAKATVDLPAWKVAAEGEARLAPTLLAQILKAGAEVPDRVPFTLAGPLDAPNVNVSVPEGLKGGVSIKIPEQLLKDKDARKRLLEQLGKGLQGALGGN